jgi:hypothetical protein
MMHSIRCAIVCIKGAERVVIFLRTTISNKFLQTLRGKKKKKKTHLENSLKLTTKHLMRKQVKHTAVTDPTCTKSTIFTSIETMCERLSSLSLSSSFFFFFGGGGVGGGCF